MYLYLYVLNELNNNILIMVGGVGGGRKRVRKFE